ncbi:MAG: hypothetical protein ACRDL7_03330 [Gaiellaceae bacterium]
MQAVRAKVRSLKVQSAAPVSDVITVGFAGQKFEIRRLPGRLVIRRAGRDQVIGIIRFGSDSSGAIWNRDECIGEYTQDGKKYRLVPIKHGRKQPDKAVSEEPVAFLLRHSN